MDTTSQPPKGPDAAFSTLVTYMATFVPASTCRGGLPASASACSHENEQPNKKPVSSSPAQTCDASLTSSTTTPSRQTR